MTKLVVIAGGTGFIGRALVDELLARGYRVAVLTRGAGQQGLPTDVRVEKWDGRTAGEWASLLDGAWAVVNLAGESIGGSGFPPDRWTKAKKERIRTSRLAAGQALVEAVERAEKKPEVAIQASGVDIYGVHADEIMTESTGAGSTFLASVAVEWEASTAPLESMGIRRAVSRNGLVLARHGGSFPLIMLPYRLFAGGPLGSGRQWWSWIHLTDAVRALVFLLETPAAEGPFNVVSPHPARQRDFGKALGRAMGRPSLIPAPGFALRLALGEVATLVLDGQRVLPQKLEEMGFEFALGELERAMEELFSKGGES